MAISNHQRFLNHCRESNAPVWFVGYWLSQVKHFPISIPPMELAERASEWRLKKDAGDLFILMNGYPTWTRIEVKEMKKNIFTGLADFPYRDRLVCACHKLDEAEIKPYLWIHLSADWKCAAKIYYYTFEHWTIRKDVPDRRYDPPTFQDCYQVNKKYIEFEKIEFPNE